MKSDGESVLASWELHCKNDFGTARFSAKTRREVIDILAEMLAEVPIDYEEAKNLKKEVIRILITKEGLKGTGKYKGWKEATETDFLASLYDIYNAKNLFTKAENQAQKNTAIKAHPLIDIWGKKKFGDAWGMNLIILANTPDSSLHNQFLNDMFGSGGKK